MGFLWLNDSSWKRANDPQMIIRYDLKKFSGSQLYLPSQ
jgi:hypothetical protein